MGSASFIDDPGPFGTLEEWQAYLERVRALPDDTPAKASGIRLAEDMIRQREAAEAKEGIPEEVVGRLLNHASKTITGQRYVRPNLDFMRSAMQIATDELRRRLQYDQLPRFKGQDQATPIYPNS